MKVEVLLYKNNPSMIGKLIRWQTDSPYYHASLLFTEEEQAYVIESHVQTGVTKRPFSQFDLDNADRFYAWGLTDEDRGVIRDFALEQEGKKYDLWGAIRFIPRSVLPENDKWFCSELVAAAFRKAEAPLLERIEDWQVSPALIAYSPKLRPVK